MSVLYSFFNHDYDNYWITGGSIEFGIYNGDDELEGTFDVVDCDCDDVDVAHDDDDD